MCLPWSRPAQCGYLRSGLNCVYSGDFSVPITALSVRRRRVFSQVTACLLQDVHPACPMKCDPADPHVLPGTAIGWQTQQSEACSRSLSAYVRRMSSCASSSAGHQPSNQLNTQAAELHGAFRPHSPQNQPGHAAAEGQPSAGRAAAMTSMRSRSPATAGKSSCPPLA